MASQPPQPTTTCSDFQYQPIDCTLPSLRLIQVQPFERDRTLTCEIKATTLPSRYSALSYCWGSARNPVRISLVSSKDQQQGYIWVRRNLYNFLRRVSKCNSEQPSWLWIDAICIDQGRVRERNHQVQQMGSIYQQATKVIVWLGEDHLVSQVLNFVNKTDDGRAKRCFQLAQASAARIEAWHQGALGVTIKRLTKNLYWSRLWVIQEVLLASDSALFVRCGSFQTTWSGFVRLNQLLSTALYPRSYSEGDDGLVGVHQMPDSPFRDLALLRIGSDYSKSSGKPSIGWALSHLKDLRCDDPRDKIYGLLSLVDHGAQFPVEYGITLINLFFATWSFFQLLAEPESTPGLLSALEIDARAVLECIDHAITLSSTPSSQQCVTLSKLRLERKILSCPVCDTSFPDLQQDWAVKNCILWCASFERWCNISLGESNNSPRAHIIHDRTQKSAEETRFHVLFQPASGSAGLSSDEIEATTVVLISPEQPTLGSIFFRLPSAEPLTAQPTRKSAWKHKRRPFSVTACPKVLLRILLLAQSHKERPFRCRAERADRGTRPNSDIVRDVDSLWISKEDIVESEAEQFPAILGSSKADLELDGDGMFGGVAFQTWPGRTDATRRCTGLRVEHV